MKTLLLTGLTGKSGAVFAQLLAAPQAAEEYTLRIALRPTSNRAALEACLPSAQLCMGDLTDFDYLAQLTQGVDVLFHIAGIHWSLPLVEAAAKNGVKRMVLVHTTGIYSKYKAAGEEYRQLEAQIATLAQTYDLRITYLRPTMIYGTLADKNMVKFIRMVDQLNPTPVVNRGAYRLQPVHAADLGQAYGQVLTHLDETAGRDYILSGRDAILLREVFGLIAENLGVRRRFPSVPFPLAYAGAWGIYLLSLTRVDLREKVQRLCEHRDFSHAEAARDFGYAPMPFVEGLAAEVRDYLRQKNGD